MTGRAHRTIRRASPNNAVRKGFSQAPVAPSPIANVKALVFDVFGTVVDWRNGVASDAERILRPLGYNIDWLTTRSRTT